MAACNDPAICALCAQKGTTCCYIAPENAELCFPLSKQEENRLRAHSKEELFLNKAPNSEAFLNVMRSLFPGEDAVITRLFPPSKSHPTLRADKNGYCLYLGPKGCTLPRGSRPWFCKIFPFWVSDGEITGFSAEYCLAARQTITVRGMLKKLGQNEAQIMDTYNRLRLDWGFVPLVPGIKPGQAHEGNGI